MEINGFQEFTLIDYPEKLACTIFFSECNFRCSYCHNSGLVLGRENARYPPEKILEFLRQRQGKLEGAVISGGEPTLQQKLEHLLEQIKELGYSIKLDTNGSMPAVLQNLREKGLVDYAAMDIKAPPYLYSQAVNKKLDLRDIKKSMGIVSTFPSYEFRTTMAPIVRGEEIEFLSPEEVGDLARWLVESTKRENHTYILQKFRVPREAPLLNRRLEEWPETPEELMSKSLERAKEYLPLAEIR